VDNLLDRLPSGARIAVIRLRSLGDCVLTTPAVALLKQFRPDLRVTVVVEPRFAPVFEGNPDIDQIHDGFTRADLAINFHGGPRSIALTLASRFRSGFAHHRGSFLYSHRIPRAQEILGVERRVHTAEHLASAMFWLGVPQTEIPRARLSANPPKERGNYAVIHPFASAPDKTWPASRFVEVAKRLSGLEPVFLAGPGDDTARFAGFRVLKNEPLARVKSLISGAALFIGNDSGPAHIAAAFGVPVVVIFGASDPVAWAPWRTEAHVLTGLDRVSVDDVLSAARVRV
jgi:lipopolysaccharide heptosyltransferase III